jgi:hypothetical protein
MRNPSISAAFLFLLVNAASSSVRAEDAPAQGGSSGEASQQAPAMVSQQEGAAPQADEATKPQAATDSAGAATQSDTAREALKQKADDASSEKNLQQVFQASEKTYSLLKKGKVSLGYSVNYSYYRDSRIDIAIADNSSSLTRFRIEEDAQHSIGNSFDLSYGVKDNLTFTADFPLVTKMDTQSDLRATGLGDISLGLRWQPIPLKRGLPTSTLFTTLSTATGDSPYEINLSDDLATGKGFYSLSFGGSMSKVADPIVLFASGSYSMSTKVSGLNQNRGGRVLDSVEPGDSIGASMGLAYSLNYDVSMTASYQQSYSFSSTYSFQNGEYVNTVGAMSAMLNFSLGLRTNPKRIVNLSMAYGLTEDAPDVTVGFSMPIDFVGRSDD